MTDRAEVEWMIEDHKKFTEEAKTKQHGGPREGAGRKEKPLKKGEKRRAVWIYATATEMRQIKKVSVDNRKRAFLAEAARS